MTKDVILVSEQEPSYILVPSPTVTADLVTHTDYVVYIPLATRETYGSIKIGDGLLIRDGEVSFDTDVMPILSISKNGEYIAPDERKNINIVLNKTDVGLDKVDNTSDEDKPVSISQQQALDAKLNKNLGSENYNKVLYVDSLGEISLKAALLDIDYEMSDVSENAVVNRVIKKYVDENGGKIDAIVLDDIEQSIIDKKVILSLQDYAKLKANQTFMGSQTILGNLTIEGDIIQNGDQYITSAEKVETEDDYILMRKGAQGGLGSGLSGFEIENYDGAGNNLRLVVDGEGTARVGNVGDEQPLLTREETTELEDGEVLVWNATANRAEGSAKFAHTSDVDTKLANKRDITTSESKLYSTDENGNQTEVTYGIAPTGYGIVQRDAGGQIAVADAVNNDHAANLGQVKTLLEDKADKGTTYTKNETDNLVLTAKEVITLTGTTDAPINLANDLVVGKFYLLSGYIWYSISFPKVKISANDYMSDEHCLVYKISDTHLMAFNSYVTFGAWLQNLGNTSYIRISNETGQIENTQGVQAIRKVNSSLRSTGIEIFAPNTGGTAGQILKSNGNYDAPTWVDMPDIPSIEGLASETYVDTKIADLVNSAPETLDTLGELAAALKENKDVVETLNSAIGNKADKDTTYTKTEVDEIKQDLQEQITTATGGEYTKVTVEGVYQQTFDADVKADQTALDDANKLITTLKQNIDGIIQNTTIIGSSEKGLELGYESHADGLFSSAIGQGARSYGLGGVSFGAASNAQGEGSTAIGSFAEVDTSMFGGGEGSVAIGYYSTANAAGVAVGSDSSAYEGSIALGHKAVAGDVSQSNSSQELWNSVQIGEGTNSTPNTVQIFKDNIYNHETHTLTVENITLNGKDMSGTINTIETKNQEQDTTITDLQNNVNDVTELVNSLYAITTDLYERDGKSAKLENSQTFSGNNIFTGTTTLAGSVTGDGVINLVKSLLAGDWDTTYASTGFASGTVGGIKNMATGLIINWGVAANVTTAEAGTKMTFAIPYTIGCVGTASSNARTSLAIQSTSTTQISFRSDSGGYLARWITIGK